ncbi:hypothetical protein [Maricaulis salignorans]|uniref:Uncharacterized protein n=1 Tax=Maricaulis salignorans TaxID=144026 RepID=A0A1G9PUH8_9PROT|nr:hypothetical protein [Maricaulis salignorans]SDM02313.1 hypothetical protein SAMN04488568_10432 [Maricaulis salignorans]
MTDRFRFFDALTYGIRTLFWRPVRALSYIAVVTLLSFGYYLWAQSDAGIAFFTGYMNATMDMAQGDFSSYGGYFAALMGVSMIISCVLIAGAYRVYVREQPALSLPLQLGADEIRTFGFYLVLLGMMIGVMLAVVIAMFILIIVFTLLLAPLLGSGGGDASQAGLIGGFVGIAVMFPLMLALGYVMGRASVGFALVIRDRRISLDGWTASKGAGMQLLWAHVVIYIVMLASQFLLAPGLMETAFSGATQPGVMPDPEQMAASMINPYGHWLIIAVPLQTTLLFLLCGPTAAVANWDARKRAAAEAPVAPVAAVEPAPGVGTGEVGPESRD